ncbi:MAG: NERD domain-containing protein [Actinobacteria bacterium]|nr:NERD domain-containing protein [Actinomycetota bacterium]
MVPRRAGQWLRGQFWWRTAVVFGLLLLSVLLAILGTRWWVLLVPASAILALTWKVSEGKTRLDPVPYLKGLRGEIAVAEILEDLGQYGYRALHDIDTGHGNIDHVLVGPAGVFAIETKNWSGAVWMKRGALVRNGREDRDATAQAVRSAMEVKRRLRRAGLDVWVDAILVSVGAPVKGSPLRLRHVTVVSSGDLGAFIRRCPERMAKPGRDSAVAAILRGDLPVTVRPISYDAPDPR